MICSLSRDPLDYVHSTINITLDYETSARGEIGTPFALGVLSQLKHRKFE